MPHVLIAGNFDFEASSANSLRVRGIVKSLRLGGAEVTIIDNCPTLNSEEPDIKEIEAGVTKISINEYRTSMNGPYSRAIKGFFLGGKAKKIAKTLNKKIDSIIIYGPHPGYIYRFRSIARENNVPFILDIVEWYEREDMPGGAFGPFALANEYSMRHLTAKADGIMVISRRLEAHYQALGCRTLRVPPLFECAPTLAEKFSAQDGRLHLCYAGSIGRKEAFGLIIKKLQSAHRRGIDFTFHVMGPERSEIQRYTEGTIDKFTDPDVGFFRFYGKIPNSEAIKIIQASDFSLVFRPLRKANQFGFPSKIAESMSLGTPVLANNFSDLPEILTDRLGLFLASSLSDDTIDSALDRAAALTGEDKRHLSATALSQAQNLFSPSMYTDALLEFVGD